LDTSDLLPVRWSRHCDGRACAASTVASGDLLTSLFRAFNRVERDVRQENFGAAAP
jgi:hypothetical protein